MGRNNLRVRGAALLVVWLIMRPATAADYRAGNLVMSQPWSNPTPPVAGVGAVYFSLTNTGLKADRLTAIGSPVASRAEIHESRRVQGMIQMRAVTFVDCPPGTTIKIEPGGLHVMLVGLTRPLTPGMQFPISLSFRDSGIIHAMVTVRAQE